jgi:hypothetical protein
MNRKGRDEMLAWREDVESVFKRADNEPDAFTASFARNTVYEGPLDDYIYRCPVMLDADMVLPFTYYGMTSMQSPGILDPLLEYSKDLKKPDPKVDHFGTFVFHGDYPEVHGDEQCDWIEISKYDCLLWHGTICKTVTP